MKMIPDSDDAKNTIQAEELIQNIKALAQDGALQREI